jgi:hypothetical protein
MVKMIFSMYPSAGFTISRTKLLLGCRVGVGTYGDLPAYVGVGA